MWVDEKGKDFLQKEFHSAVLKIGPAPFEIVEDICGKCKNQFPFSNLSISLEASLRESVSGL